MNIFHNFFLKFFAIVLSTLLWIFIVGYKNPIYKFNQQISVQPFNLVSNLTVDGDLGSVQIRITTDAETLDKLKMEDFEAYVDLKNEEEGTVTKDISVTSKNPKVTVISYEPTSVKVDIKPMSEAKFPVEVRAQGTPLKGYHIKNITVEPKEVTVKASQSILDKLQASKKIYADMVLTGTESETLKVELPIAKDENMKNTTTDPLKITATITFEKEDQLRTVGIVPKIIGKVQSGVIESITLDPSTITIVGDQSLINSIQSISTEAIDLKTVETTQSRIVKLILPAGIKLADGMSDKVKININYKPLVP